MSKEPFTNAFACAADELTASDDPAAVASLRALVHKEAESPFHPSFNVQHVRSMIAAYRLAELALKQASTHHQTGDQTNADAAAAEVVGWAGWLSKQHDRILDADDGIPYDLEDIAFVAAGLSWLLHARLQTLQSAPGQIDGLKYHRHQYSEAKVFLEDGHAPEQLLAELRMFTERNEALLNSAHDQAAARASVFDRP